MFCGCKYTPVKKRHGYDVQIRKQAIRLYGDGMNLRRTARHLGIHHRTKALWVKEHVRHLPETPQPKKIKTAEMDELFTYIDKKKQNLLDYAGGSANTVHFGLESGVGT